jgi:hypothetical protein
MARQSDRELETIVFSREGGDWLAFHERLSMSPRLSIIKNAQRVSPRDRRSRPFLGGSRSSRHRAAGFPLLGLTAEWLLLSLVAPFAAAILKQINAISLRRWPSGSEQGGP